MRCVYSSEYIKACTYISLDVQVAKTNRGKDFRYLTIKSEENESLKNKVLILLTFNYKNQHSHPLGGVLNMNTNPIFFYF